MGFSRRECWSGVPFPSPMFIAARFTTAKVRKQTKCSSTDEWIEKWRGILLSHLKKSENSPLAAEWMDLEGNVLSELSRTKANTCDIASMCNLLCCWKRVFVMTSALSWQNSISLCQICLLLQFFLTSYFCIPLPYNEKDIFFWC